MGYISYSRADIQKSTAREEKVKRSQDDERRDSTLAYWASWYTAGKQRLGTLPPRARPQQRWPPRPRRQSPPRLRRTWHGLHRNRQWQIRPPLHLCRLRSQPYRRDPHWRLQTAVSP